jgi:exopolysaccharide production protein ExoZ
MRQKLQFLQALRALAALLVVADHAIYYLGTKQEVGQPLQGLAWHLGTFGVDVFFVISGFIMIHTSRDLFDTRWGFAQFFYRRIVRIVPLYWLATMLAAVLLIRHQFPSTFEIASSLLFVPVVTEPGQPLRPILGVGWTLNFEMFFYALFTISLCFSRRIGIALLVLFLLALVAAGTLLKPLTDTADPLTTATFLSDPILLLFAAGVLLGAAMDGSRGVTLRIPFAGGLAIGLVAAGVVVFIFFVHGAPWTLGWQVVFWTLCIAIVFLAVAAAERPQSGLLFSLERLGDASYSVYLFHFIIIAAIGRVWLTGFGHIHPLAFCVFAFAAAGGGGLLIHLWLERPLLFGLRYLWPALSRIWAPVSPG